MTGQDSTGTGMADGSGDNRHAVTEARLESVLATAPDGIIVIDEAGRILTFNKSSETLFGYAAAEAIGRNVSMIMPADYAARHDGYLKAYVDTGHRRIIGIGREVAGRHRDGTVFPIELSVGEAHTPQGRQFIGIIRDLRPRKAVEQRLSQLQAQIVHMTRLSAMDEMGAAMAHELNQPLTALMLYLQAVLRPLRAEGQMPVEPARLIAILEKALAEAERAGGIIQRMRQMVEKRDPERSRVDLRGLIDEAIDLSDFVAQGSAVTIRRAYGIAPFFVDVDPIQIQQILLNLIRNAIEVAKESREKWVEVGLSSTTSAAMVTVVDSGPGLPPEMARTLFRTFSTTKKSGMGLGLAISRSIAQNHGGDLSADPGGHGRGATFRLTIPLGDAGGAEDVREE